MMRAFAAILWQVRCEEPDVIRARRCYLEAMGNVATRPKAVRRAKTISKDAGPLWSEGFVEDLAKAARAATRNAAAVHRAAGRLRNSKSVEPPTGRGSRKA
jgi:hypothetical protein